MDHAIHTLSELFRQLGLASDAQSIAGFIARHRPLTSAIALPDAPFWKPAQQAFLRQQIAADADWSAWVDDLDVRLRQ